MTAPLALYVIYERPPDFPTKYVLRIWHLQPGIRAQEDATVLADDPETLRQNLPADAARVSNYDKLENPQYIFEVWI